MGVGGRTSGFSLKDDTASLGARQVTSLICLLNGCVRLNLFTILLCYSSFLLFLGKIIYKWTKSE